MMYSTYLEFSSYSYMYLNVVFFFQNFVYLIYSHTQFNLINLNNNIDYFNETFFLLNLT